MVVADRRFVLLLPAVAAPRCPPGVALWLGIVASSLYRYMFVALWTETVDFKLGKLLLGEDGVCLLLARNGPRSRLRVVVHSAVEHPQLALLYFPTRTWGERFRFYFPSPALTDVPGGHIPVLSSPGRRGLDGVIKRIVVLVVVLLLFPLGRDDGIPQPILVGCLDGIQKP